jgi:hypothetical protein
MLAYHLSHSISPMLGISEKGSLELFAKADFELCAVLISVSWVTELQSHGALLIHCIFTTCLQTLASYIFLLFETLNIFPLLSEAASKHLLGSSALFWKNWCDSEPPTPTDSNHLQSNWLNEINYYDDLNQELET